MSERDDEAPKLIACRMTFEQRADCCDDLRRKHQRLVVEMYDGGAGVYPVLRTSRWALNQPGDLGDLLRRVRRSWYALGAQRGDDDE